MGKIILKEGVNSSVKLFHDGQIGTFSSEIDDQIEENQRDSQDLIPVSLKCRKI